MEVITYGSAPFSRKGRDLVGKHFAEQRRGLMVKSRAELRMVSSTRILPPKVSHGGGIGVDDG